MAVLSYLPALGVVALTGCYEPQLRDCAVTCVADADCSPSQVCGSDGMCASPSLAGRCPRHAGSTFDGSLDAESAVDATVVADAAPDAAPPVDAPVPTTVLLRIVIRGRGRVDVSGTSLTCSETSPNHTCTFMVESGDPRTLVAVPDANTHFEKWGMSCSGTVASCTLTPVAPLTSVEAKFKNGSDDD